MVWSAVTPAARRRSGHATVNSGGVTSVGPRKRLRSDPRRAATADGTPAMTAKPPEKYDPEQHERQIEAVKALPPVAAAALAARRRRETAQVV